MIVYIAGAEACDGFLMPGGDIYGTYATPQMREFAKKYQHIYGEPLVYLGACAYLGADAIIRAMKKADSIDTMVVRDTLADMRCNGVLGPTNES